MAKSKKKSNSLLGSKLNLSKKQLSTLLTALVILGIGATYWFATHAATSGVAIKNPVSGRCLDAYGRGTTDGTTTDIYDCVGSDNQQWTIQSNGTIVGSGSGKCLNADSSSHNVTIWTCNGASYQKWTLDNGALINGATINGKSACLDVYGQGTGNSTKVDVYQCSGTANQQWVVGSGKGGAPSGGKGAADNCVNHTYQSGSSGDCVKYIQSILNEVNHAYGPAGGHANGYGYGNGADVSVDGSFGSKTRDQVKVFQKWVGLTADGVVGSNTWGSGKTSSLCGYGAQNALNNNSGNDATVRAGYAAAIDAGCTAH